jgi:hypothetical protein
MREASMGRLNPAGNANLPAGAIGAGAESTITATCTGAVVGDAAIANPTAALDVGLVVKNVWVSAANTVSVTVRNDTAAPVVATANVFNCMVLSRN